MGLDFIIGTLTLHHIRDSCGRETVNRHPAENLLYFERGFENVPSSLRRAATALVTGAKGFAVAISH